MAKQTVDDVKEKAASRLHDAEAFAEDKIDALSERLGDRRRAIACVGAGSAAIVVALAVALSHIPLTAGPVIDTGNTGGAASAEQTPADDVGHGISGSDRSKNAEQSDQSSSALVPDEAKTVTELSQQKVVTAKVTDVVDGTHLTCQLVNGDTVTVRLLDVTSGTDPMLKAGGPVPYVLAKEGRSIWLERDRVATEDDGTWPRYLWTADPTKRSSDATVDLYQCYGCSPERNWFTYTAEDNANTYATSFEKVAGEQTEKTKEQVEAEQRDQWEARKRQQEAIENARGNSVNTTDTKSDQVLMLPPEGSVLPDK